MELFNQADPKDHKSVDVYTFYPWKNPERINQLEEYVNNISENKDRLINNYINIQWYDQKAISLLLMNNKIMGFSTVWNREFYGTDTVRIFNRWWEDPSLRQTSKIIGDSHLVAVANHQLQIANELAFDWAFISRERTPNYLKKVVDVLDDKTNYKWIFNPNKISVCNPEAKECQQWVGYTNLKGLDNKWGMLK